MLGLDVGDCLPDKGVHHGLGESLLEGESFLGLGNLSIYFQPQQSVCMVGVCLVKFGLDVVELLLGGRKFVLGLL